MCLPRKHDLIKEVLGKLLLDLIGLLERSRLKCYWTGNTQQWINFQYDFLLSPQSNWFRPQLNSWIVDVKLPIDPPPPPQYKYIQSDFPH